MVCPVCRTRPSRRACPALGRDICPVCCGTKRLVEIHCPSDCGYLISAKAHPAAAVRRQEEADVAFMATLAEGLAGSARQLAWGIVRFVAGVGADPLLRLTDEDLEDCASSLASTYDTAARGLIYEHRPRTLMAQRLATDLKRFLDQAAGEQGGRAFDRDAAAALGRLAESVKQRRQSAGADRAACLATIARMVRAAEDEERQREAVQGASPAKGPAETGSTIILR